MSEQSDSGTPRTWWQWILVYPTLAITLVSAIPTFLQLYRSLTMDVPYSKVASAINQDTLWKRNSQCLAARQIEGFTTSQGSNISLLECANGDLLVVLPKGLHWIAAEEIQVKKAQASIMFREAFASDRGMDHQLVAQGSRTVICQRWLRDGLLLLRVRYSNGQCFDEVINTYTGAVVSSTIAPCDPNC